MGIPHYRDLIDIKIKQYHTKVSNTPITREAKM